MTFDQLIVGSILVAKYLAPGIASIPVYYLTVRLRDAWARR